MEKPRKVIKKYENRRLYDTSNSRYVNLDDIAQMVREGTDVQVVDAASGEDLTRLVLTQIIVEHAKTPDSAFPLDMLRQMVIASGRVGREGVTNYMKAIFDTYQNAYRALTPGLNPFDFLEVKTNPVYRPAETIQPPVDDLRKRIEELERLVARNKRTAGADKRRTGAAKRSRRA